MQRPHDAIKGDNDHLDRVHGILAEFPSNWDHSAKWLTAKILQCACMHCAVVRLLKLIGSIGMHWPDVRCNVS